jgi:hypothetical protein
MPAAYVKPYVKRGKSDALDAEGICEAVTRPTMRFVAVKDLEQQAVLMLHRTRDLLVRQRTMVAFRRHTLLPLDDCLYALQPTIPHLTRSSLHRCLQRHSISRLPDMTGDKPDKKKFKSYPIGYFHIDIAEVHTEEGRLYLFVAIDRTSKFAFAQLHERATRRVAADFLRAHCSRAVQDPHGSDRQRHAVRR